MSLFLCQNSNQLKGTNMKHIKYDGKYYHSLYKFCAEYNLSYDSLRYNSRKYGSVVNFMSYINEHPDVVPILIDRYTIAENKS